MPLFGNQYSLPAYVAQPLVEDNKIIFNRGSHIEAIRMRYADFARLVNPTAIDYTYVVE